jgi:hypothetical protein
MEAYLEEFVFSTKPPNFGVEAHMEALVGVALSSAEGKTDPRPMWENMNRIGSDGVDVVPSKRTRRTCIATAHNTSSYEPTFSGT